MPFLKFTSFLLLVISFGFTHAQANKISKADSLFRAKQYTQSIELYKKVLLEKKYSPAMLLKMAYIEEGLGKIGPTLFYLKLYQVASQDDQALQKMEELATKFNLVGYQTTDANRAARWIEKNKSIMLSILALFLLLAAVFLFVQRAKNQRPVIAGIATVVLGLIILFFNNTSVAPSVIIGSDNTYLMEGPSAGAPVATVLSEGNQLESIGQEDVWLKVKWNDKVVYVKENAVLKATL